MASFQFLISLPIESVPLRIRDSLIKYTGHITNYPSSGAGRESRKSAMPVWEIGMNLDRLAHRKGVSDGTEIFQINGILRGKGGLFAGFYPVLSNWKGMADFLKRMFGANHEL